VERGELARLRKASAELPQKERSTTRRRGGAGRGARVKSPPCKVSSLLMRKKTQEQAVIASVSKGRGGGFFAQSDDGCIRGRRDVGRKRKRKNPGSGNSRFRMVWATSGQLTE